MNRSLKRGSQDEPFFLDNQLYPELDNLIKKINWPYKTDYKNELVKRDRALFAFLLLTGLRVSEALNVKRMQIRIYENRIEAVNLKTLKRGNMRSIIILPKIGSLRNLTYVFEAWLVLVKEPEAYLFPKYLTLVKRFDYKNHINRHRAYQLISLTGKFPHWARSVCETIYGRKIFLNDAWKLKEFMGLKRLDSTAPYISGSWEENQKNIYKL